MRNSKEAQLKSIVSMREHFGVDYAMQSSAVMSKAKQTLLDKYSVDNAMKDPNICKQSHDSRNQNWIQKVHLLLPPKIQYVETSPHIPIDDDSLTVYILREEASKEFLGHYGFRICPKFGKIHLSLGLVRDGILYQVIRFEKRYRSDKISLADFGIRQGYFNPNYYSKLTKFAIEQRGIESFDAIIPRNVASPETIQSLSLHKVSEGEYQVFWIEDNKLIRLTQRHNIEDMLKDHDYITTDYLDKYSSN